MTLFPTTLPPVKNSLFVRAHRSRFLLLKHLRIWSNTIKDIFLGLLQRLINRVFNFSKNNSISRENFCSLLTRQCLYLVYKLFTMLTQGSLDSNPSFHTPVLDLFCHRLRGIVTVFIWVDLYQTLGAYQHLSEIDSFWLRATTFA